jgi:hypothetical protein
MTKLDQYAPVNCVRAILHQEAPLPKLEEGKLDLQRLLVACKHDLEEFDAQRKIAIVDAPVDEMVKTRAALREREAVIKDLMETASTILGALEPRLAEKREEERVAQEMARRSELNARRDDAVSFIKNSLFEITAKTREMMRVYGAVEDAIADFNRALGPGGPKVPSIEAARIKVQPKKLVGEPFDVYVGDGMMVPARDVRGGIKAAPLGGGWFEVYLPGGSTGGGTVHRCQLVPYVRVHTEEDSTPRPKPLPMALNVPAFDATHQPGWRGLDRFRRPSTGAQRARIGGAHLAAVEIRRARYDAFRLACA